MQKKNPIAVFSWTGALYFGNGTFLLFSFRQCWHRSWGVWMDPGDIFFLLHRSYISCINLDVHKGKTFHCYVGLELQAMQVLPISVLHFHFKNKEAHFLLDCCKPQHFTLLIFKSERNFCTDIFTMSAQPVLVYELVWNIRIILRIDFFKNKMNF